MLIRTLEKKRKKSKIVKSRKNRKTEETIGIDLILEKITTFNLCLLLLQKSIFISSFFYVTKYERKLDVI